MTEGLVISTALLEILYGEYEYGQFELWIPYVKNVRVFNIKKTFC